jgi:hypothetical protein
MKNPRATTIDDADTAKPVTFVTGHHLD